jgi:hypothetical protein
VNPPEFNGDSDIKDYMRRLELWEELTLTPAAKRAVVLYYKLKDKAWKDAETLDLRRLRSNQGMEYFKKWLSKKYEDQEFMDMAKHLRSFFRVLRRKKGQDVREFNNEFDRQTNACATTSAGVIK